MPNIINLASTTGLTDVEIKYLTIVSISLLQNLIITSNKAKHAFVEKELKNYRSLTQFFLSVKVTLVMMEYNFTLHFNCFIIL